MMTSLLVRTVADFKDAIFASVGRKAPPTKLVLAATGHVITSLVLLDAVAAFGAALEFFPVFEKLQKSYLLGSTSVFVVFLASSTAVPLAMVVEARFVVAGMATHDGVSVLTRMQLTRTTSRQCAPAKLGIFFEEAVKKSFVVPNEILCGCVLAKVCMCELGRTPTLDAYAINRKLRLFTTLPNVLLNALATNCTDSGTPNSYLVSWNLAFGTVARADVANNIAPRHLRRHLLDVLVILLVCAKAVGGAYIFRAPLDVLALLLVVCVDVEGAHNILRAPLEAEQTPKEFHGRVKC